MFINLSLLRKVIILYSDWAKSEYFSQFQQPLA
jgi:hypothetical protein